MLEKKLDDMIVDNATPEDGEIRLTLRKDGGPTIHLRNDNVLSLSVGDVEPLS